MHQHQEIPVIAQLNPLGHCRKCYCYMARPQFHQQLLGLKFNNINETHNSGVDLLLAAPTVCMTHKRMHPAPGTWHISSAFAAERRMGFFIPTSMSHARSCVTCSKQTSTVKGDFANQASK